jgi:hypothetical protein
MAMKLRRLKIMAATGAGAAAASRVMKAVAAAHPEDDAITFHISGARVYRCWQAMKPRRKTPKK